MASRGGLHTWLRATLIGTVLQLTVVVWEHLSGTGPGRRMTLSLAAAVATGLVWGLSHRGGRWAAALGGATAAGAGAALALLEAFYLRDVTGAAAAAGVVQAMLAGAAAPLVCRLLRR